MQGCGLLQGALSPDPRVWNFSSAGNWEIGEEPLHRFWESFTPVHQNLLRGWVTIQENPDTSDEEYAAQENQMRVTGAGLGLSFGRAMADATGKSIGLIAAAHGGTTLAQWDFRLKDQGGESLYGAMLERVKIALQDGGTLRGILWYQGESDANDNDAPTYSARLKEWIEAARADLNSPDLPVIIAQIGCVTRAHCEDPSEGWQAPPWEKIRQSLLETPDNVPHTAIAATIDLGLVDTIHIDTPGLIRLGKRLARLALGEKTPRATKLESFITAHGYGGARVICEGVNGTWNPRTHIAGFQACNADGSVHQTIYVIDASSDEDNPQNIRLLFNVPLDKSVWVGYGLGCNPYCNAADENDMALCAFLPMPIS